MGENSWLIEDSVDTHPFVVGSVSGIHTVSTQTTENPQATGQEVPPWTDVRIVGHQHLGSIETQMSPA